MWTRSLLTLCLALLCAGTAGAQDRLPPAVQQALQRSGLPADALAAIALPLDHRARSWRHRATAQVQPGSTMKLLTSIVALERLGPQQRGSTELRSAAVIADGVLHGDLVLKGGADPELGVPQLWALLSELRQRGVQRIAGDLLLDRSLFRPTRTDLGRPPFDESPEFEYNVIPDALHLASSLLTLDIASTETGARVNAWPTLQGLEISAEMQPGTARCADWDEGWQPARISRDEAGNTRIRLQGSFPRDCTQRTQLQLIDRDELAERLMRTLWQGLGGSWAGQAREAATPEGSTLLARHTARPWGEVLRHMNKTSDNAEARLLYLLLGVPPMAANPQATTAELAEREVRAWLAEQRIDASALVLDNGSGLSRSERLTPLLMASVLKAAWAGRHVHDLLATLPTAGVDGTMRRRLKDSSAAGWARLKTGTLSNVVALAGVVRDARGRRWAVAMMLNHVDANKLGRPVLDALVDSLARGELRARPTRRSR